MAGDDEVKRGLGQDGQEDDAAAPTQWIAVDKSMLSRLLYPNPVCLLSSRGDSDSDNDGDVAGRNVMTITWLTPINNQGGFVCSINAGRHTASIIGTPGASFVLNVPVRGMEELVLAIGGTSGSAGDKLKQLGISTCAPGGGKIDSEAVEDSAEVNSTASSDSNSTASKKRKLSKKELARHEIASAARRSFAIRDCAAHVLCRVETVTEDDGHLLLRCSQLAGWVREGYWDGRNFIPRDDRSPPYLTFLGSKVFGYVVPGGATPAYKGEAIQSDSPTKA